MQSPLHPLHEKNEADFQAYADTPIVLTFGEPQAEYAAVRKGAAIFDFPQRGILELTGKDRLVFLNNMLTNQAWDKQAKSPMPAGTGVYAFFLNRQGRVTADMNVLELGERTWLELDARMAEPLRKELDKYLFREQVKMEGRVGALHQLFVAGPEAPAALAKGAGGALPELAPLGSATIMLAGQEVVVFRDDVAGVPGFALVMPVETAQAVWTLFTQSPAEPAAIQELKFRGLARPAGWAAYNTTRIEAGRPLFGIDFDESILPAETGAFARAVSTTKGCYLGQEIVARMHARGQVAKQLVGIRMDADALPIAGTKIYDEKSNEVGGVTSSTLSPILSNAAIALGYVKKPFIPVGSKIQIPAEGAMRGATVVELPFVK